MIRTGDVSKKVLKSQVVAQAVSTTDISRLKDGGGGAQNAD